LLVGHATFIHPLYLIFIFTGTGLGVSLVTSKRDAYCAQFVYHARYWGSRSVARMEAPLSSPRSTVIAH
jgi:hypothetical protein